MNTQKIIIFVMTLSILVSVIFINCTRTDSSYWETIILNGEYSKAIPGDFDGDENVEIITGNKWFRPVTQEFGTIEEKLINGGVGAREVDIDGDGVMELVGAISKGRNDKGEYIWEMYWSKPVNGLSKPWEKHFMHSGHLGQPHDVVPYDMDNDGISELIVIGMYFEPPGVYIYKSGLNPQKEWTRYTVSQGKYCDGTAVGDFDGDGKIDISSGPYLYLNRSTDSFSGPWEEIHLAPDFRGYCVAASLDITGNGRKDIIIAESEYIDCRISWFENRIIEDPENPWIEHPLDKSYIYLHSISAWKGKKEEACLFLAEMEKGGWRQPYNLNAKLLQYTSYDKGKSWNKEILSQGLGTWQGVAYDLNKDGQMEIVGRNRFNSTYIWQKSEKPHFNVSYYHRFLDLAKEWPSTDILASDVDGDGKEDVVCGAFWYKNSDWKKRQIEGIYQILTANDVDGDGRDEYIGLKANQEKKDLMGDFVDYESALDGTLYWLDPVDPENNNWEIHTIGTSSINSERAVSPTAVVIPLVKDGGKALVTHMSGKFKIFEIPSSQLKSLWKERILAEAQDCSPELLSGDLNNDGLIDLVGRWKWLENAGDGTFIDHEIVDRSGDVSGLKDGDHVLADINKDGLLDLVASEITYTKDIREPVKSIVWLFENHIHEHIKDVGSIWGRVIWFENPGGVNKKWIAHTINYIRSPGSVNAADFDGDGDIEVICGEYGQKPQRSGSRLFIFKKFDKEGNQWTRHLVDERFMHYNGTKFVKLESGKIGIASHATGEGSWVHLYEPVVAKPN